MQPKMENQKVQKMQCGKIPEIIFLYYLNLFYKASVDYDKTFQGGWLVRGKCSFSLSDFRIPALFKQ